MDFLTHVQKAVCAYITTLIWGDSQGLRGWAEPLANAEETLAGIDRAIETYTRRGEDDYLPSLRIQRVEALAHRDRLKGDVDCLHRLAHDVRMRDAFALLPREFSDDEQWYSFIYSAWAARMDFAKYRNRLKRAAELKGEIADAAEKLAKLIRQFAELGCDNGPGEFYSIPELLRQTDNHERHGHNLHMWRSMRRYVLGDPPRRDDPEAKPVEERGEPMPPIEIVLVPMEGKAEIAPEEEVRNTLHYAWGTAPDFPALLGTVANAARAFKPRESGMIGAAIESRQKSLKTEYLRAFGNQLTEAHKFALTTPIMKAMAIVANVVINLPDVDVTYDDVRKALAKLGGERLENSGEK